MINSENIKDGTNYCVGAASGYAAYRYLPKLAKKPMRAYLKTSIGSVSNAENNLYYDRAIDAYENSFLSKSNNNKKLVEIKHVDVSNAREIANEIKDRWLNPKKNDILHKKWFKRIFGDKCKQVDKHVKITSMGQNAFCVPRLKDKSSLVVVNKDKMGFSTFHELGHAMNAQCSGYKNFLSKVRGPISLFVPLTLFTGLLTNRPKDNDSNSGKFVNFVKNNCGLIAAGCMLPTLAEEGVASINGAKLAKDVLNNKMYKNLNKLNTKAWCSYLFATVLIGGAVQIAVNLRDKIVANKPIQKIFN